MILSYREVTVSLQPYAELDQIAPVILKSHSLLLLSVLGNSCLCCGLLTFLTFSNILSGILSVSKGLDPDQDRHFVGLDLDQNVGPDLGPKFSESKLFANVISRS